MRIVEGGDPNNIADRVAYIEKTPRVRVKPFSPRRPGDITEDNEAWEQGPKGSGGNVSHGGPIYGRYPPSREWCDKRLVELGYELPEEPTHVYLSLTEEGLLASPEEILGEMDEMDRLIASGQAVPISFNDGADRVPVATQDNIPDVSAILESISKYPKNAQYVLTRVCRYAQELEMALKSKD